METAGEICRRQMLLAPAQIAVLDRVAAALELVSDLAHSQVTVYIKGSEAGTLVVAAQVRPHTTFVQHRSNLAGTVVHGSEEPLVWRTMSSGQPISGQREWALGMLMKMQTYPLRDAAGALIAVVSFETTLDEARAEGHELLIETAYWLLAAVGIAASSTLYRSLTASDGVILVSAEGKVIFANSAADSLYKVLGVGNVVGRRIYERQLHMRLLQKAVNNREVYEAELAVGPLVITQRAIPILRENEVRRAILIVTDRTELKKKERELLIKSAVIQEIHHRVKNNLQTIASLLRLQARRTHSPEVKAALRESVNRILSISVVHEFLSQQDAEVIDVMEVAKNILDLVMQNMLEPGFTLHTVFNGETVILPSEQASNLALVINELIQNSIEHAFPGRHEGTIGVDVVAQPEQYCIRIYDDGIGLPDDFTLQSSNSLGLQIVRTLVESDLGGKFEFFNQNGTSACITISRSTEEGA
ncbi:sensor histidine kinase [Azotosporobacter soli]|uniref:sensor histidine kinase n=1 Tax=Azotosporobacter soli TaxID=3055040 RepID=UPI0031FEC26F